ncbi:hypothetical protein QU665_02545 [Actinomyces oris]|uniref:Uncharacterized protein n=1 Tax=Actinomyces oris TaxID=544580 RepID=A0AAW9KFR1_9ACTO|nr:hypothetical protein [Actinomyces oris]MEA1303970.1 hypothetical protein [Actinomyces oris]
MRPHQLGIRLVGIELTLNPRQLSPQPLLLLLEQLQRHRPTVVRLQQPAPLILQVRPPHRQRPNAPILLPLDSRQLRQQIPLNLLAIRLTDVQPPIHLLHLCLHHLNEHRLERAVM